MVNVLELLGREQELFSDDISEFSYQLLELVSSSRFLVLGGAGTIGQAVTKEIFKRNPRALHVVDISENNLVELVRDLRSSFGYIDGEFRTFALDIGSVEFRAMLKTVDGYDIRPLSYNELPEQDENYIEAYIGLGQLFLELEDKKQAQQYLNQALELEPGNSEAESLMQKVILLPSG